MSDHRYLVALGSNRRHALFGSPRQIVALAADAVNDNLGEVLALSTIIRSMPVGPSQRRFANAALVVESDLAPPDMLEGLQVIETAMGRTRRGRRWQARTLDLDIVLWSGGIWASDNLAIPHPLFRTRDFVLRPAAAIAPSWRDPLTGLTLRHLAARLSRRPSASR
ncbi:MAG: 2-amino-4-hydroxy-6-hydroxymethyldihydropteridine diphosphokinase [Alteraurantiacibacter sp.]